MLTAVIGTIITLTMLAHHRNKKSNKTRKLQLNFEFNFYIELIFTLYYRSTKSWDGSTIGSKKAPKHEIAFFLFSFLEKQKKFFSDEKNRKNRYYEWRFEVRAKRVAQIRHECNGF